MQDVGTVTQLLVKHTQGDANALAELLPQVYSELRKLAIRHMSRERRNHTLQPTALVHEAYIKLIDQNSVEWQNRAHFFAVAATLMRRVLIDHARSNKALKRGGECIRVSFDEALHPQGSSLRPPEIDVIELDRAMKNLAKLNERQSQVVELRYFGGLSIEETANVLDISPATVKREWAFSIIRRPPRPTHHNA